LAYEDQLLLKLVGEHGTNWTKVANDWRLTQSTSSRSGKQIRDRWVKILDPSVSKAPWTKEEDARLLELHREFGNSWSKIADHLPGRIGETVKARFRVRVRANEATALPPKKQKGAQIEDAALLLRLMLSPKSTSKRQAPAEARPGEPVEKKAKAVKGAPVEKKAKAVKGEPVEKKAEAVKGAPVEKKAEAVKGAPVEKKAKAGSMMSILDVYR
jgi:hypothetical protein